MHGSDQQLLLTVVFKHHPGLALVNACATVAHNAD